MDTLIQTFTSGDSIVQYAMQLWFLILKLDIELAPDETPASHQATADPKLFKILHKANLLQMVICRMCLFFDKLLILERLSGN